MVHWAIFFTNKWGIHSFRDIFFRQKPHTKLLKMTKNLLLFEGFFYIGYYDNSCLFYTNFISYFITVAPKVVPFTAPSNLQQGDRATLTCTVARGDSPLTLMWMKDGEPIPRGKSSYKVLNFDEFNSMLTLESLNLEHIGNYSCRASNPAGESSVETQLIVYGKFYVISRKNSFLLFLYFSPTRFSALQFWQHDFHFFYF